MTAALATAAAIIVALVAAQAGYLFRRREHLRERRLDAYQIVCAAFLDAARSAADLLSVHTRVSWPRDLSPKTGNEDQRAAMTKAHADAWQRASADRRSFEIAAYGVELVASKESREAVERLRVFLEGAAYSGTP